MRKSFTFISKFIMFAAFSIVITAASLYAQSGTITLVPTDMHFEVVDPALTSVADVSTIVFTGLEYKNVNDGDGGGTISPGDTAQIDGVFGISSFVNTNGQQVIPPGFNFTWEMTGTYLELNDTVISVSGAITYVTTPGMGILTLYVSTDMTQQANFNTGLGFDDGTMVAQFLVQQGGGSYVIAGALDGGRDFLGLKQSSLANFFDPDISAASFDSNLDADDDNNGIGGDDPIPTAWKYPVATPEVDFPWSYYVTIDGTLRFGDVEPLCGDGNLDPGETCDPPTGYCTGATLPRTPCITDGDCPAGETCGLPVAPAGGGDADRTCRNGDGSPDECTYCGDGIENNGEECDDGNDNNDDGCTNDCMIVMNPDIDIEKVTNSVDNQNTTPPNFDNEDDANGPGVPVIPAGSDIIWTYKVTNTGDVAFAKSDVIVQDSVAEVNVTLVLVDDDDGDDILSPGEMWFYEATGTALDLLNPPEPLPDGVNIVEGCSNSFGDPQPPTATYMNTATVTVDGLDDSDDSHYCGPPPPECDVIVTKTCVVPPPDDGAQGCTPGYWKQDQHFGSWVGYNQSDDYETVFGVDASFTTTLLGAMEQGGGGEIALGRHAVAALLNASNPDVDYFTDEAGVIALVQDAYTTGAFETVKNVLDFENNRGCSLNSNSSSDGDVVDDSVTVQQAGAEECTVTAGTLVKYNYEIENTGSVNLSIIEVIDDPDPGNPFEVPGSPVQDLAPGDTETLMSQAVIDETTTNTVTVTGNPGPEQCIAMDTVTVIVRERPPITRTIGYWKNHPTVIDGSFDGPGGFPSLLPLEFCGEDIVESCDAVSFLSTGGGGINCFKRQAMGALLNCQAFGCPDEILNMIMTGSDSCGNGMTFNFDAACSVLDAYNNFGDDLDLPFQSPSAQSKFCEETTQLNKSKQK